MNDSRLNGSSGDSNTIPKNIALSIRNTFRHATALARIKPSFFIVGAQKAGTTSLSAWLSQHPVVARPFSKEVHFFDDGLSSAENTYAKGALWYRSHFPLRSMFSQKLITFEASPSYMFDSVALARLKTFCPRAKILIMLRDPTARAISHYFHSKKYGLEHRDIEEAMSEERIISESDYSNGRYDRHQYIHHSYKARGLYARQLSRVFEHFDKEQVAIYSAELLFEKPEKVMSEIFSFLELNPNSSTVDLAPKNVNPEKQIVAPKVYQFLDDFFQAPNQELFQMIGSEHAVTFSTARQRIETVLDF